MTSKIQCYQAEGSLCLCLNRSCELVRQNSSLGDLCIDSQRAAINHAMGLVQRTWQMLNAKEKTFKIVGLRGGSVVNNPVCSSRWPIFCSQHPYWLKKKKKIEKYKKLPQNFHMPIASGFLLLHWLVSYQLDTQSQSQLKGGREP